MPAHWFGPECQPLLHCLVVHLALDESLEEPIRRERKAGRLDKVELLTRIREREEQCAIRLSAALRLNPRSKTSVEYANACDSTMGEAPMSRRIVVDVTYTAATGFTSRCGVSGPTLNTLRHRLTRAYGGAVDVVLSLDARARARYALAMSLGVRRRSSPAPTLAAGGR
jgi:hypothetical protein